MAKVLKEESALDVAVRKLADLRNRLDKQGPGGSHNLLICWSRREGSNLRPADYELSPGPT